jgi:hypothetical protein
VPITALGAFYLARMGIKWRGDVEQLRAEEKEAQHAG